MGETCLLLNDLRVSDWMNEWIKMVWFSCWIINFMGKADVSSQIQMNRQCCSYVGYVIQLCICKMTKIQNLYRTNFISNKSRESPSHKAKFLLKCHVWLTNIRRLALAWMSCKIMLLEFQYFPSFSIERSFSTIITTI